MEHLAETQKFPTFDPKQKENLGEWMADFQTWIERKVYAESTLRINWLLGLNAYASWNPGSIAAGGKEAKDITVTGAALGDFAIASFSLDVEDLILNAQVTAADTVTVVLANNTGGAINLGSGTVYVRVFKR